MKPIDTNYLKLQFWINIYQKNATEFQTFFEDIMQKAYPDFKKIRPYGKQGDAGNDGYLPDEGAYYQVYAPASPAEKQSTAVRKFKNDFIKLKQSWDQISKIKSYHFVFNDKGGGSTMDLERALSELKGENQGIDFEIFTPKNLERIFFKLKNSDLLALGFDVDETKSVNIINEYLTKVQINLDRELGNSASKALANIKEIVLNLQNDRLQLKFELLEARALQLTENFEVATNIYDSLCKRFPDDPHAFLYLAEYYLNQDNIDTCDKYLKSAEKIDNSHWLLSLQMLFRDLILDKKISLSEIDEGSFPNDFRVKSIFYRIYALFMIRSGEYTKAESFIERAIFLNPDRLQNFQARLLLLEVQVPTKTDKKDMFQKGLREYLTEIQSLEQKAIEWGEVRPRVQAFICLMKLWVAYGLETLYEIKGLVGSSFEFLMRCSFDKQIDDLMVRLLNQALLPSKDLDELLGYLQKSKVKRISNLLAKALAIQFLFRGILLNKGKEFFSSIHCTEMLEFIDTIQGENYSNTWEILKKDTDFAIAVVGGAKDYPDLRRLIIKSLPNDGTIQKEKLLLLINYDERNFDEAFSLLKDFDFSNLSIAECRPILEIAREKRAWDFVVVIIDKLLKYETDNKNILQLKLQLCYAYLQLNNSIDTIKVGESILSNSSDLAILDDKNKENLLAQVILSRLKRGVYNEAMTLLEQHSFPSASFEFKISIEAEVYLKNNIAEKALSTIVDAIKSIKIPSPEQYGSLFFLFSVIGNMIDFRLSSLEQVVDNCFVKIKDQERWYFVGNNDELDATRVSSDDKKYSLFMQKKKGETIELESRYQSSKIEFIIEDILSIDKYILFQCLYHAKKLSLEQRWDQMELIEVPTTGDTIDPKYIIARLEDYHKNRSGFLDLYCEENLPFAFLSLSEGGIANAIGCINNEKRGFIKFSSGHISEINHQKANAARIIFGERFYIDGTSALVLSESGLLQQIYDYLPNILIPQSVISMLFDIKGKFAFTPGQIGHMAYRQGKISFSDIDKDKAGLIQENIDKSIALLETKPENIKVISDANKADCISERKVPPESCDACILAQNDGALVLTEDFLYLQANEFETKKKSPEYCSSFALIRTLYEQRKVSFNQYLAYFGYLSSYRFRFLPISTNDIEKAVIGDEAIKIIDPAKIRYFNFSLTLSPEYGVPFKTAFHVVGKFLIKVLLDDSILPDITEKIFAEILSTFPAKSDKNNLGQMFIQLSIQTISNIRQNIILGSAVQEKITLLSQHAATYQEKNILLP